MDNRSSSRKDNVVYRCRKCQVQFPNIVYQKLKSGMHRSFFRCPLCGHKTHVVVGYTRVDTIKKAKEYWNMVNIPKG